MKDLSATLVSEVDLDKNDRSASYWYYLSLVSQPIYSESTTNKALCCDILRLWGAALETLSGMQIPSE